MHQRGLAGAGRSHDRGEAALLEGERHPIEGSDGGVALAVGLAQVDNADGSRGVVRAAGMGELLG